MAVMQPSGSGAGGAEGEGPGPKWLPGPIMPPGWAWQRKSADGSC